MSSGKKVDFIAKALAAWDNNPPAYVVKLSEDCQKVGQAAIAKRIGYSVSTVSYVLGNKYPGDLAKVEAAVRGALMGAKVMCPVFGEMDTDYCLAEQRKTHMTGTPERARLYRLCRGIGVPKCEHSLIRGRGDA